ncbi:MAG: beta-lactamase family protein [Candidatus Aminicenantes bacterium]|nr:beta-lactamase family protein [Candidatus Aminicenantes bacterium]
MTFEKFIHTLIEREVIPGISLLIGKGENIILERHYGYKSLLPHRVALEENTLYDVASLTKPLVTALAAVYLIEKGELSLDAVVKKYFPVLPFDIEVSHLLTHTSGLPAWFPFYLYGEDYLDTFKRLRLEAKPGRKVNYSCVGYILLHYLIEKVSGVPFKDFIEQLIFKPLGLKDTYLQPPPGLRERAAPTEAGNRYEREMAQKEHGRLASAFAWRDYLIQGETHDANSYYLGGSAGNAGLFSTAAGLFRLSLEFFPSTGLLLKPESIALCWKNFTPFKKSHRSLGFKLNSSFITSGGRALSREAIGHSGFTGASLWLDPRGEYKYILLSNRIHPRVKAFNFNRARRKLHGLLKREGLASK